MFGLGTIVNATAIAAGSVAGLLIKKGFSESFKTALTNAVGIAVLFIGISGTLTGLFRVSGGSNRLSTEDTLFMILCLVIGTAIGELLHLDRAFDAAGNFLSKRFAKEGDGNFTKGFVSCTILYCVGAMAIVGAIEDGLSGNPTTLFAKSILDGVTAMLFASTLGVGVLFSAGSVLLYQGLITICAIFLRGVVTPDIMAQTSMVGSALIFCIGFNVLNIKKLNVANMLPAAFLPMLYAAIKPLFGYLGLGG